MNERPGQEAIASPEPVLNRVAARFTDKFEGIFSPETVERVVFESYTALARTATVTTHLPSLAEKFARDRLTALAQSQGLVTKTVPEILYVCVQNSGRSQMAAALTKHIAGDRVHVRSAGSQPAASLLPNVVEALAEIGIPMDEAFPKPLTDDVVRAADAVVTMGCGDACPLYPGKRYLDWDLADPAGLDLDGTRKVRDEIQRQIEHLLAELGQESKLGDVAEANS
ncbi:arsenate reductase ArsC [Gulosibacter molinativorax]|uniref:Arsenate reductase ArsC n=1 Tax=Gulosibacter molinativorax TaxID=256821 RepID=A0ABT7C6R1_9MICO|nr:arsenate reductase ArsC [Gulosibacter molinativorax]MDJ1370837.1 arsenate reductase ArsC [Gulosibacter molinativorax]QUY62174.1 Putative arsenate reductase (ArsC) [Gulosibacter molinativorax]